MKRKNNQRTKRIKISVTDDEEALLKQLAADNNTSIAQLVRTIIHQTKNKDVNDTAKTIQSVEKMLEEKLLKFADAQDTATAFLINNMAEFYETKIEKLEKKVNEMAPYYAEVKRIFTANEAKKRKERSRKRNNNQGAVTH